MIPSQVHRKLRLNLNRKILSKIYNLYIQLLEKQEFKTIVAIDEFQQILNYPEKNNNAWLRTRM